MNTIHLSATLIVALSTAGGCAGSRPVPIKAPETYAASAQYEGIVVGVEAYDTSAKSDSALGSNVTREFTPIHLAMQNRAIDKYLVERGKTTLTCSDGTVLEPASGLDMYQAYRENTLVPSLLGAHMAAEASIDDNARMQTQWTQHEFPVQSILTGGGEARGFVYFRGVCRYRLGRSLNVTFEKLTSPEAVTLKIALK